MSRIIDWIKEKYSKKDRSIEELMQDSFDKLHDVINALELDMHSTHFSPQLLESMYIDMQKLPSYPFFYNPVVDKAYAYSDSIERVLKKLDEMPTNDEYVNNAKIILANMTIGYGLLSSTAVHDDFIKLNNSFFDRVIEQDKLLLDTKLNAFESRENYIEVGSRILTKTFDFGKVKNDERAQLDTQRTYYLLPLEKETIGNYEEHFTSTQQTK